MLFISWCTIHFEQTVGFTDPRATQDFLFDRFTLQYVQYLAATAKYVISMVSWPISSHRLQRDLGVLATLQGWFLMLGIHVPTNISAKL